MRLSLNQKILLVVASLVCLVLLVQGVFSGRMVLTVLHKNTLAQLTGEATAKVGRLTALVRGTGEDMAVIAAHKDMENLFTSLIFEDTEGATEATARLEFFLKRVHAAKAQYTHMQISKADGRPLLQLDKGERVEKFTDFNQGDRLAQVKESGAGRAFFPVHEEDGGWALLAAVPLIVEGQMEGVLWLHQSIQGALDEILAELKQAGISGVVVAQPDGVPVTQEKGLAEHVAKELPRGTLPGWVTVNRPLDALGWKVVLGVEETGAFAVIRNLALTGIFAALALVAVIWLFTRRAIIRRLMHIQERLGEMAGGNLLKRVTVAEQPDEIDEISINVNRLADELSRNIRTISLQSGSVTAFIQEILRIRKTLGEDSDGVSVLSREVADKNTHLVQEVSNIKELVNQISTRMVGVNAEVKTLSDSIVVIAQEAERANQDVSTTASAAEQMSANVAEVNTSMMQMNQAVEREALAVDHLKIALEDVRGRCAEASRESAQASARTKATVEVMNRLSTSAKSIGDVVDLINNIADQTNMLALNAAIEAAGAGNAGRGFAVVAGEIKELARQTGDATRMIGDQIERIQSHVAEANDANQEIVHSIGRIFESNSKINGAVDDQGKAIADIDQAMVAVLSASETVGRNTRELEQGAQEVARAASEVAGATHGIAESSAQAARAAQDAAEQTGEAETFSRSTLQSAETTEAAATAVGGKMDESLRLLGFMRGSVNHFRSMGDVARNISDALHAAQSNFNIGIEPFNIQEMKARHLNLLGLLEKAAVGGMTLDPKKMGVQAGCGLEDCLNDEKKAAFRENPICNQVLESHRLLHESATQIAHLINGGLLAEAKTAMLAFHQLRKTFFDQLNAVYLGNLGAASDEEKGPFVWDASWSVGHEGIDADHQRLVDLINQLADASGSGESAKIIGDVLRELGEYARDHFRREEEVMIASGFPGTAVHQEQHRKFVNTLADLEDNYREDPFTLTLNTLDFMRNWLTHHVKGTDKLLGDHLASRST